GVRSRLPGPQRDFLDNAQAFLPVPISWLINLPEHQKDAAGAIEAFQVLPAHERISVLTFNFDTPPQVLQVLKNLAIRGSWLPSEAEILRTAYHLRGSNLRPAVLQNMLTAWTEPEAFGEQYLQALQSYYQVFFVEEEQRIRPALQTSLKQAQELASQLPFKKLLEHLSHGVHFSESLEEQEVILAPCYWSSPLIFYRSLDANRMAILFGARSEHETLVPGELVPHELLAALKAMADPTRLRILRYLAKEPVTPTDLAHRLRLRPPTVIHHLNALRLAGLVQVSLMSEGEKRYALRKEAVQLTLKNLEEFLS
ncbi:MAG: winged helix-turn-helix transcriptional regulator, partial [Anaerolineaceae bacterium]|nr:winged helix-turn-helix transcriptional regulator [Anaerolineaceae bacterium]